MVTTKTEEFLAKLKASGHWNEEEYDYSGVRYVGTEKKVSIVHKRFGTRHEVLPKDLLKRGTSMVARNTVEKSKFFIGCFREVHGDVYDYSEVVYEASAKNVIIICKEHGRFEQTPSNHIRGSKCPKCIGRHIPSTDEAIDDFKLVHGDVYDYSMVRYTKNDAKVIIICKSHGQFQQRPSSHKKGAGCPKCCKNTRLTSEEAINRFKSVHGDMYDYSKVKYVDTKSKVIIICKEHGHFQQTPDEHGSGRGCPRCTKHRQYSHEEVVQQFKSVHGDLYDYSDVKYELGHKPVAITCRVHGVFYQKPSHHKSGHGCPRCGKSFKPTHEEVIQQFKSAHGDRYDYSEVKYEKASKNVTIICRKHGPFQQTSDSHKSGHGCLKCVGIYRPSTDEAIEQFRSVHGSTYDYSEVEYVSNTKKVTIICSVHGRFQQAPSVHNLGSGCPNCTKGLTKAYALQLIDSLSESDLLRMSPFELFIIIKQGKLPKEFKKLMNTMEGTQERVTSLKELKKQYEDGREGQSQKHGDLLTHIVNDVDEEITKLEEATKSRLPAVSPINAIRSLDRSIYAGMDEIAIASLVQFRLRELWNAVLRNETTAEAIRQEVGGHYFTTIKSLFLDEHKKVAAIKPNSGYASHAPNMMQKLTVHRLLTNKSYGNWSGTGAGKTLSFILSSRKLDARLTVVVALNNAIEQARRDITTAYPDSVCHIEYNEGRVFDRKKHNYLILNYEKFQQSDSERLFQSLTKNNQIDFIVLDEVHHAKQREEQQESIRRAVMTRLLERAREDNLELHVLAMSATPVINGLYEAKSLLTLMTGLDYNDLDTRTGVDNALDVFKELTLKGLRFIPKYDIDMNVLTGQHMSNLNIDGQHLLDAVVAVKPKTYADVEKILLPDKLKVITPYLKKGAVVYSYYTDGIIQETVRHIRACGFKVATYTGNEDQSVREKSLQDFIAGRIDILVGSKPIGTSVDGLQTVSDRLIALTLPWTDAEFTQLKGRVYRQGSKFKTVDVIIPQVRIGLEGYEFWSWDIQRYNLITRKKTLADVAVDGAIPSAIIPSAETLFKKGKQSLEAWKQRVASGKVIEHVRQRVQFDLYPEVNDDGERRRRAQSELSEFNRLGKITGSTKMHDKFRSDPSSWHRYHLLRKENTESWDEVPYEYIATKIKHANDVVADFGCGENLMRNCIPNNKVYAFDHVAIDDSVVACDMRNTHLEDRSVDIAVFSLALWGSNWVDYIKEAHRVLTKRGCLYIAEPLSAYETEEDRKKLMSDIESIGFQQLGELESRGRFLYLTLIKQ